MRKIKYTATFPDGQVLTRASEREYTTAWRVVQAETGRVGRTGFCGPGKKPSGLYWVPKFDGKGRRRLKIDIEKERAELEKKFIVEIVPVTIVS